MDQNIAMWMAVLGCAIGVLGGVIGTYCSIRSTNGPRERSCVVRAAVVCSLIILAFLAALWIVPDPYRPFLWVPYAFGLPLAIRYWNGEQQRIRREESGGAAG